MKKILLLVSVGLFSLSLLATDAKKYACDDLKGMETRAKKDGDCVQKRYYDLQQFLTGLCNATDSKNLTKTQDTMNTYCSCCKTSCEGKGLKILPSFTYKAVGKYSKTYTNILLMWVPTLTYDKDCTPEQKGAMNGKQWFMDCTEC